MDKNINVVSCRNINIISEYVKRHIGSDTTLLSGLPFTPEHLKFEHNWIPLSLYSDVMDRAIELLRDPQAPYKIGLSAMSSGSWGAIRYVQQIFMAVALGPVAVFRSLGMFNPHFNATKVMSLVNAKEDRCLVRIKFNEGINPIDDFHSDAYIQGLFASVPQNWKLPLATIRPITKEYDLKSLLQKVGGLPDGEIVCNECAVAVRGEVVGEKVYLNENDFGIITAPYCVSKDRYHKVLPPEGFSESSTGILITRNTEVNDYLFLQEGEVYNASSFLYDISWEKLTFGKKIKHLVFDAIGSKRAYLEGMERSLATIRNYVETLEDKVSERTEQLNLAKQDAEYWREKAEVLLTTMLPAHIVKDMMHGRLQAKEVYGSVMYTDLAGFTAYSKDLPPHEVEAQLTQYFTAMTEIIARNNGWVNKFLGDGILVIFGLDENTGDPTENAGKAAVEMQNSTSGYPWQTRIGIATGPFVTGEFGSTDLRRFDCIGHTMNLGSRLQGLANNGGALVCSETHKRLCKYGFRFLPKRMVSVKGVGVVPAYPLVGHREHKRKVSSKLEQLPNA